ncbi:MAG: TIGR00341 family protein [Halobacteriota archaeon]
MRVVRLLVPEADRETVQDVLVSEDIDFVEFEDATGGEPRTVVEFPLPVQAVSVVLRQLEEAGIDSRTYTVITGGETALTSNYKALEDRFVDGVEGDESVAVEEIRGKALGLHRGNRTYYTMTVLSAIVATAGLLLDSPAVVVGAMVIAPQVGSAMITSVAIALNDRKLIRLGLRSQAAGLAAAILASLAFGWALRSGQFVTAVLNVTTVSQITQRISPGLLSVSVALCAGAAGAFGLATALPVSLVGVMIAAALIPAAAAVGIGLAWGLPSVALGAFVLLVVNVVAVNLGGFLVLWYLGYRPADRESDEWSIREMKPALVALGIILVTLVVSGLVVVDQIAYENDVNTAVSQVLEDPTYDELGVTEVRSQVRHVSMLQREPEVTVVVSRPVDQPYPRLASRLQRRIESITGESVAVEVQFVERQRVDATPQVAASSERGVLVHPSNRTPVWRLTDRGRRRG